MSNYVDFYRQFFDVEFSNDQETFVTVVCPFCNKAPEKKAGFDVNTGVFNCFVCAESFSAAGFLAKLKGEKLDAATLFVDQYRRVNELRTIEDTWVKFRVTSKKFDDLKIKSKEIDIAQIPMVRAYAESRGLTIETLKRFGIGYLPAEFTRWHRNSIVFPYTYGNNTVGIRYRDAEGNKSGELGCQLTLFGLDLLPKEKSPITFIAEGESDAMRIWQELQQDTVGVPGGKFREVFKRELNSIVKAVIPQADETSKNFVKSLGETFNGDARIISLPWKRFQYGKDVCEWLAEPENSVEEFKYIVSQELAIDRRVYFTGTDFDEYEEEGETALIENFLYEGQIVSIAGPAKNKKTWLVLNFVLCLLRQGTEFLGIPTLKSICADPKILFVEEEGSRTKFRDRVRKVLRGIAWQGMTGWAHKSGVQLDEREGIDQLIEWIKTDGYNVLVLDPFQNMFSGDENTGKDMAIVWKNLLKLSRLFPKLVIVILFHFGKEGEIEKGLNSIRGHSSIGGKTDVAILVENRSRKEPDGAKITIISKDNEPILDEQGNSVIKLLFNAKTGLLLLDTMERDPDEDLTADQKKFFEICKQKGRWSLADAARFFGKNKKTISLWMKKFEDDLDLMGGHRGAEGMIVYNKDVMDETSAGEN